MSSDLLLIAIACATSMITAITGIGGGMILIAIMPGFLPATAIVPVHALVQLFSNSSRALFGWRFLRWEFVLAFIAGSIVGGAIAAGISREINLEYTPLFIAAYILFTVWGPVPKFSKPPRGEFVIIGAVQTGLSMLVGATGPMGQAALMDKGLQRDALVVSGALMTTFTHLIKVVHPPDQGRAVRSAGIFLCQLLADYRRHVHRRNPRRVAGHADSLPRSGGTVSPHPQVGADAAGAAHDLPDILGLAKRAAGISANERIEIIADTFQLRNGCGLCREESGTVRI